VVETTEHGEVREIRLARPPVNALDVALLGHVRAALAAAVRDGKRAAVLSGTPGRFSGGLDVPALLRLERPGIRELWVQLFGLLREIATSEIPVAAALTGHSPAGGTVLAIFTDYRVLADGPYRLGLNEVEVGLAVPSALLRALAYVVGARQAERLAVGGLLVGPAEALRCGLVDEVVAGDQVVARAVEWATTLLARPRAAMLATRRLARAPLLASVAELDTHAIIDGMVDQWFSPETQAALRALVARLGKKA
jgi:enoyl-CoA hydratase/carnithine racemase